MTWQSDEDAGVEVLSPVAHDGVQEVDLDALVTRRTAPRVRALQVGALLALVIVFGGLVFRGYQAAQPRPEPTTAPAVVDDFSMNVAIFTNVNYGTLTVNGEKLTTRLPAIVKLRQGQNTITISAPPFQPHTCTYDMSRQSVEGAHCDGGGSVSPPFTFGGKKASTSVIVPMTVTDLPTSQQRDVEALVAQAIDGVVFHTTVPAHQYIATGVDAQGHVTSRLTSEELQADAALVRQSSQFGPTCVENICAPIPNLFTPSDTPVPTWTAATFVASQWRFRTRSGDSVATVTTSPLSEGPQNEIEVALAYDATGGWRVTGAPTDGHAPNTLAITSNLDCTGGMYALAAYVTADASGSVSMLSNGIEGCELQLLNSSGKPAASFIWRFGVLLAADPAAHKMIQSIPIAPQAEIDAVTK